MNKNITPLSGITNQILLYAKGWYGKSLDNIADIKKIISKYCGLEIEYIPDNDVWELLASTFSECVKKDFEVKEAILEMLGKHMGGGKIFNRPPEKVIIGKLSIADGGYVTMTEKMSDFKIEIVFP